MINLECTLGPEPCPARRTLTLYIQVIGHLADLVSKVGTQEALSQHITRLQRMFKLPETPFPDLAGVQGAVGDRWALWQQRQQWHESTTTWLNTPLNQVGPCWGER